MRWLVRAAALGLVLAAVFVGSIFAASELGGEVVVVHTRDPDGADRATHLWVVDHAGFAWLRSGVPGSAWFRRLEESPDVVVERSGESRRFRAMLVRDPETRDRIHALMREKYGFADRWISAIRDGSGSIPIRLEPLGLEPLD